MVKYDHIIIGTGQAGPPLAEKLASHGQSVAIIEKGQLGGSCVNTGCTPTKAYIASARRAWVVRYSTQMGVSIKGEAMVDLKTVKSRKDKIIQESRDDLEKKLTETENITLYRGEARFTGPHSVRVNGTTLEADHIYINTGGRPNVLPGYEGIDYLTNESILELEDLPEHLIIIGAGYIGLEFGQMFHRFGSKVTILEEGDRIMAGEDEDISADIYKILTAEGLDIRLNADIHEASQKGDEIQIKIHSKKGDASIAGSHLLMAVGRKPNTDNLGLEKAGVKCDDHGYIQVNDELVTNVPHIRAMGDCNGEGAFTHTAFNDFQIVYSQLFQEKKRYLSDRITCYAAFIDPALARVGMNEKEIKKKKIRAKKAVMPMDKIARAKEKGETDGQMKIYIDPDKNTFLGATFLGAGADEYIHTIIDMMYSGAPYTTVRDAVHIHPTISELIPTMLERLEDV